MHVTQTARHQSCDLNSETHALGAMLQCFHKNSISPRGLCKLGRVTV